MKTLDRHPRSCYIMNGYSFNTMNIYSLEVYIIKDLIGKSIKDALQEKLIAARPNQILDASTRAFAEKDFLTDMILDGIGSDKS